MVTVNLKKVRNVNLILKSFLYEYFDVRLNFCVGESFYKQLVFERRLG